MQHLGSQKQNSNLEADGNSGRARGGGCRRLRQRHIVIIIFEEGPNDHELPVLLRHGHGRAFLDLQLLPVRVDLLQLQPGAEAFDEVVRLGVYVGARAVRRCRRRSNRRNLLLPLQHRRWRRRWRHWGRRRRKRVGVVHDTAPGIQWRLLRIPLRAYLLLRVRARARRPCPHWSWRWLRRSGARRRLWWFP
uniref:Uncharacterized protein n=1 Tax=Triticum urartu TaxID=4572 RepID=A0A8R7TVL1_TRIUA